MNRGKFLGILFVATFIFPLWLTGTPARAVLLSVEDSVFGSGSVTRDTDSGLEWLDVNLSTNRSYSEVSAEFGSGGDFMGWRYATTADMTALFAGQGISSPHNVIPGTDAFLVTLEMFGKTLFAGDNEQHITATLGVFDDGSGTGYAELVSLINFGVLEDNANINPNTPFGPSETSGSWLVRSVAVSVPEPGTLLLFGIGVVGLGFARRHQALRLT